MRWLHTSRMFMNRNIVKGNIQAVPRISFPTQSPFREPLYRLDRFLSYQNGLVSWDGYTVFQLGNQVQRGSMSGPKSHSR